MKTKIIAWADESARNRLLQTLQAGNIVVGSSDTVLGFLADVSEQGFNALNAVKRRESKPYLLLIASQEQVPYFVDKKDITPAAAKLMQACWPGPLTLIMKAKKDIPEYMVSLQGTIALRVPDHAGLLAILPHFKALFSTSANLTGEPVPASRDELNPALIQAVTYVVFDEKKEPQSVPSTLVDCTQQEIRIIREGSYSSHQIQALIEDNYDIRKARKE